MKGLLKGLRYISQIFDTKEQEMQIGHPTDVKHVAHIGWDGPSVNPPSWMNEFRSAPLSALGAEAMADQSPARLPSNDQCSSDFNRSSRSTHDSPLREVPEKLVLKPRRQASASSAMAGDSPTESPGILGHCRRNKSATGMFIDSPTREPSSSRRYAAIGGGGNSGLSTPTDSPVRDLPLIPKVTRKKKAKEGSGATAGGGSSRSARSKARAQLPEGGDATQRNGENGPVTPSPDAGEGV